ncbi:MAG: response regulator transcription factor [Rubricoccaceae bacterium]
MPHRVYIVEDHPVMREGYSRLLSQEPDFELCGAAGSAEDALPAIEQEAPDLAIIDLQLPGSNGIELIKRLRSLELAVRILVVSAHEESLYAERALKAGAQGYLMKFESARNVVEASRQVLAGRRYLSESLQSRMMDQWLGGQPTDGETAISTLSDREIEVFEWIGRGKTTLQIAELLSLSPKTIESHRANIKRKLNVDKSPELIQRAVVWVESLID